jgi:16S rRNA (guanine527-N7)-methyltransferase
MLPAGAELPPEDFLPLLDRAAASVSLSLPRPARDLLARYLAQLDRARRRTNLTGPFPAEELARHAVESALAAASVPEGLAVDVGSGAGFPGVPIACLRPDVTVLPVEPRRLRREFLDGCGRDLPLANLAPARASLAAVEPGSAASALARAVGDLPRVLGRAPFLAPRGLFLAWTTDPDGLDRALAPVFGFEDVLPVPGSDRKVIARFRRR